LTLVYRPKNLVYGAADEFPLVVDIGILWKALPLARAVLTARSDMFSQVYWHHSVRAMKAMLAYALRRILISLDTEEKELRFWHAFKEFVLMGEARIIKTELDLQNGGGDEAASLFDGPTGTGEFPATSGADDAVLRLLWSFADASGRRVIDAIRKRKIYRRLAVLSADVEKQRYEEVYGAFRTYRLDRNHGELERQREKWEKEIRRMVKEHCRAKLGAVVSYKGTEDVDLAINQMEATVPLILVDVPVKATARVREEKGSLWFLEERARGGAKASKELLLDFKQASIDLGQKAFDLSVGKIRVFVAPEWRDLITHFLSPDEVISVITG